MNGRIQTNNHLVQYSVSLLLLVCGLNPDSVLGASRSGNDSPHGVVVFLKADPGCDSSEATCLGGSVCVPVCTSFTDPEQPGANDDGLADDRAWENGGPCIIPGTVTEQGNTRCDPGAPTLPKPEPRPGILINGDPEPNSCRWNECAPLCQVVTESAHPLHPDWGFEDNRPCVLPFTPTHLRLPQGDVARGCKEGEDDTASCHYDYPPRECTWGAEPVNQMVPPAKASGSFSIRGAELIDTGGKPFVIRGINNSHAWYDTCGQYMAWRALDDIAAQGANTVRVGWAFESIQPVNEPQKEVIGTTPELLAEILHRIVELEMVAILAINDSTGQKNGRWATTIAEFYVEPEIKEILLAYEPFVMLGLGNELNVAAGEYFTAYDRAVKTLRKHGLNHTAVITGNDWGQGCDAILTHGKRLMDSDPRHNILFDIHIYNYLTYKGGHGGTAQMVQGCLDDIAAAGLPLVVGEFGHVHGDSPVEWETIVERADANGQGTTPWLWFGDTEYPVLNLNETWDGPLTPWGQQMLPLNGAKASMFQ